MCRLHSVAKLKELTRAIITQPVPAESAQQLRSALETNCEMYTHSGTWQQGRVWNNPPFFFFSPYLHATSSPSSEQAAARHLCSLTAIIISSPFPTKASANHFPHLSKSHSVQGK